MDAWRESLIRLMELFALIALPVSMLIAFPIFITEEHYLLLGFETTALAALVAWIFMKKVDYIFRAFFWMIVLYATTVLFFALLGPNHARSGWLVMCGVFATLLFGLRGAVLAAAVNAAILLGLYKMLGPGLHSWSAEYSDPFTKWAMFVVNISLMTLGAGLSISYIVARLDKALKRERAGREKISREAERAKASLEALRRETSNHRLVENSLQRTEEKFRLLAESVSDVIFTMDLNMNYTYLSPAAERLRGYKPEESMAQGLEKSLTPESLERGRKLFFEEVSQAMREDPPDLNKTVTVELEMIHKNGSIVPVEIKASFLRDEKNRPTGILGVTRNITERRKAEQALRESEERYALALKGSNIAYWDRDLRTGVTIRDKGAEKIYGYSLEEMGSSSEWFEERVHPDDLPGVIAARERHLNGLTPNYEAEYRLRRKSGEWIWIQGRGQVVERDRDGRPLRFVGILLDITARKKMEEALQRGEKRYRDLLENIGEVIYTLDTRGRITYTSPACEQVVGYQAEELTGRYASELIHPEDLARLTEGFQGLLDGGGQMLEYRLVHKSGDVRWVQSIGKPVYDEDKLSGLQCILLDITQRKQAEKEKERLERQLLQAQKMEAIGTLAGGIAHDFNNILSAIIGYAQLSQFLIPENSPALERIGQVIKASHRARDLVQQILAFSRQGEQEMRPVQIGPIVREALKLLRASIPATVDIEQHIQPDLKPVMADQTRIHQVLMSLCANAFHAMEKTGGVLTVSLAAEELDRSTAAFYDLRPGLYLKLSVRDTGQGIDPSVMDRIFDPYFTTKEVGVGTGLGLSVVHGIVRSHLGAISVSSEPGTGSEFRVYLPCIEKRPEPEIDTRPVLPRGSERVLLVDDEEALVDIGRQILEELGYSVVANTSSLAALDIFRADPGGFDLVITDMTMPKMTGDKLAVAMMNIRPDIPVIICTGFSANLSPESAQALGIKAYLEKPLKVGELASTIRQVLDKSRAGKVSLNP